MGELNVTVMMAASAVALSARSGQVTQHDVEDLRVKTEELLGRDDPMRGPILTFASMYEVHRRDREAVRALGEDLWRAIGWGTATASTVPHRRDIDG